MVIDFDFSTARDEEEEEKRRRLLEEAKAIELPGRAVNTPRVILGQSVADIPGMVEPGTIDVNSRFGSPITIDDGGLKVIVPSVVNDQELTKEGAQEYYRQTGHNLGMFKDAVSADYYAEQLHKRQEAQAGAGEPQEYGMKAVAPSQEKLRSYGGIEQVDMITPGTIDLDKRTPIEIPEGIKDTERAISYTDFDKGITVLIPTVIYGKVAGNATAIKHYKDTGEHLGVFKNELAADEYSNKLYDRQAQFYGLAPKVPTQMANGTISNVSQLGPTLPKKEEEDIIPLEPVAARPGGLPAADEGFDFSSAKTATEPAPQFEKQGYFATEESEARNKGLGPSAGVSSQNARGAANRDRLFNAIADLEEQGYKVPHFIGTDNEPEGDRGPTMDMENLATALKQKEDDALKKGDKAKAAEAAKDRAYWEDKIKTEGMSAEQWRKQTSEPEPTGFDFSSAKDEEPLDFDFSSAKTNAHSVAIVTAYRPGGNASMGLSSGIEGGNEDAHGEPIIGRTTVEDFLAGRGDYATVAMDKTSSWQNQFLSSPAFPGIPFRVRDNGGYGNNKTGENWIDIAFTDPNKAKSLLMRGVPFTPISPDEAQKLSESRPNLDHTPRLQALYVPGGSFSYKETPPQGGPPDPFIEFTARGVRGVEMGTREMFGGAISIADAATRGERNVYLDEEEPEEKAKGDIPVLEEQIATLHKQMRNQVLKDDPEASKWVDDTTFDSPEIQKLDKQLRQARRAAAGDLSENVLGQFSRQTERLAKEAEANQVKAAKKYEPYISQAGNTKWGFMLADALGSTIPGVLASLVNPVFGATAIYAQIYQASIQEYITQKPDAPREEAQKFASEKALAQTPWFIAGNQLTARALKASFAALPAGAVERGSRIFGTQVGQAIAKNAEAFIGNVGSAMGASVMSDMVSEDYDLLEDTTLGEKFRRSLEPASIAGGVSLVFGAGGLAAAAAKRPAAKSAPAEAKSEPAAAKSAKPKEEIKSFQELPPGEEISFAPKALPAPAEWIVQHASPHDFERFALANIGTGEGHQAFGRGLYFSEGVGTHKSYMEQFGGEGKAVSYKVKINANKDHFIDWDKPISEQGDFVKDKLKAAGILDPDGTLSFKVVTPNEKARSAKMKVSEFMRVQMPYADMTAIKMALGQSLRSPDYPINSPQGAAEFLNSIGIKGIRYLDAASRGKAEGARNIVIFDENIVEIIEKNGKPVAPKPISTAPEATQLALPEPAKAKALPPTAAESEYGPPTPGQARPKYAPIPEALPPSTSIVPKAPTLPAEHIVSIIPLLQNPEMRRHVNYAPGQREGFGWFRSPVRQWQRFFIGTSEVFEKTPGLEELGQKLRDYVDDKAMLKGRDDEWARQWVKTVSSQQKTIAQEEFHRFFLQANDPDVNVQKQAVPTYWAASDKGRELIDLTRDYFNRTGIEHQKLGLVVLDPTTQKFRPIGKVAGGGDPIPPTWYPGWKPGYFPRMIHRDHMKIIRDPTGNVTAYEKLKDQVEAMGFPRDSIDAHLNGLKEKASSNEFFASLDLARSAKVPQTWFDYSFDSVRRYMSARADRLSQIKNFGQVKAHTGPESLTLFDDYLKNVKMDAHTQAYIERVRNHVLNIQLSPEPSVLAMGKLGTLLTGIHLGNPITASRNLAGGQASIAGILGVKHYAKGVKDAFNNIDEAYEKGIIIDDLSNLMEQSEGLGRIQKFTNLALKWSGEQAAENFNRVVNMGAAKSMLRDAIKEYKRDPFSRRSRQYFGDFKRMGGIDPQALMDEGGKGPMTDRYLRQSVRYIQGGYQIDQTPAFQNTNEARFFFKYSKWGTQHTDLFSKEVIRPAIRELTFGKYKQEFVDIRDPATGKMKKVPVPGKLSTAVRYFLAMAAGGAAATAFARYAFGIEDKTETWTEIVRKLDRNDQEAFFDILHKLFQYGLISGVGGYLGNIAQYGVDWTQKVRQKDPLNPPITELAKDSVQLMLDAAHNGGVPRLDDLDNYLRRNSSGYRSAKQAAAYWGNDVFPLGFRELQRESMLQDLKWSRSFIQRYEKESGVAAPSPWRPGVGTQTPMSRFHYKIKEALLIGDVQGATDLMDAHFEGMTKHEREVAMDSLMDSVRAGRPIKVGGSTSQAAVAGFLRWADENASAEDAAKLRRIDETYIETAVVARILKLGKGKAPPTTTDIEEQLREMQMRKQLREVE